MLFFRKIHFSCIRSYLICKSALALSVHITDDIFPLYCTVHTSTQQISSLTWNDDSVRGCQSSVLRAGQIRRTTPGPKMCMHSSLMCFHQVFSYKHTAGRRHVRKWIKSNSSSSGNGMLVCWSGMCCFCRGCGGVVFFIC